MSLRTNRRSSVEAFTDRATKIIIIIKTDTYKGEHTALYKINKTVYIKPSKIIIM